MDSATSTNSYLTVEELAIQSLIPDVISRNEKYNSNFYLLQWLKSEKLNPAKTEARIRKSLEWRQKNEIETGWNDEVFLEFKKAYGWLQGLDKQNCPVAYMQAGAKDYRKGASIYGSKTWPKYWAKNFSILEDLVFTFNNEKKADKGPIITFETSKEMTIIVDVKNFSFYQLASLNVNKVFQGAFKFLKPILAVPYLTMEVYRNEREWRDRVLQIIDEDQLNKFLNI